MITIKDGDIFNSGADIICHQVNTYGVMGAGIALQVKNKFPNVYKEYEKYCFDHEDDEILGKILLLTTPDNTIIANLFSQEGMVTNYDALRKCLEGVYSTASNLKRSVAIPYNIGCGIAKGDWTVVEKIIRDIFENTPVDCTIWRFNP